MYITTLIEALTVLATEKALERGREYVRTNNPPPGGTEKTVTARNGGKRDAA